jgi:Leu/Phe-tRNA-protein transferase
LEVAASGCRLDFAKAIGENSCADSSRARLERVCRALDRLGVSFLDCQLESLEASGTILRERIEENCQHLLNAAFTKVRSEALDIYAWRRPRDN